MTSLADHIRETGTTRSSTSASRRRSAIEIRPSVLKRQLRRRAHVADQETMACQISTHKSLAPYRDCLGLELRDNREDRGPRQFR